MISFLREFAAFLLERKKYWLAAAGVHRHGHIRRTYRAHEGHGGCAVHLHAVLTGHARPRDFSVLPRQRGRVDRRRAHRGRRAGRTLHPQEVRCQLSAPRDRNGVGEWATTSAGVGNGHALKNSKRK